jgi:topoisomerase-4 subunit A
MYNDGVRGGRVKIRAKIKQIDSKLLQITEIPYGSNTSSIIDSIIKANERGKIKIKKIEDNTAEFVEILIYLNPGISPDKTIDALYAFTDCEISISPNCCVIENNRPLFLSISEVLKRSTNNTLSILKKELEFQLKELKLLWHQSCLEIIFIKYKLYLLIQDCESWDEILIQIKKGLKPYLSMLKDKIEEEDIIKLTELKIKKISKFDFLRAEANLKQVEKNISDVKFNLSNIINYSIEYFKNLKKKYKHGNERKTESRLFNTIIASKVAIRNKKIIHK